MFGNYTGKMFYLTESTQRKTGTDGEDTPEGADVAVKVEANDCVYLTVSR